MCGGVHLPLAMYELKTFIDRPEVDSSVCPFRQHLSRLVSFR